MQKAYAPWPSAGQGGSWGGEHHIIGSGLRGRDAGADDSLRTGQRLATAGGLAAGAGRDASIIIQARYRSASTSNEKAEDC